jgi:hypothetical protein
MVLWRAGIRARSVREGNDERKGRIAHDAKQEVVRIQGEVDLGRMDAIHGGSRDEATLSRFVKFLEFCASVDKYLQKRPASPTVRACEGPRPKSDPTDRKDGRVCLDVCRSLARAQGEQNERNLIHRETGLPVYLLLPLQYHGQRIVNSNFWDAMMYTYFPECPNKA